MKHRVLLLEGIHPVAKERLESVGCEVILKDYAPEESELVELAREVEIIGIRSKTNLTTEFFEKAETVAAVGCFCIGTNQVDLTAANHKAVAVFNAPYSNTRSVAELVICEVIALSRRLSERSHAAHQGQWLKSASGSREIRGKTLGIIGYGHIGSQLSVLAEALGMNVIFYDVMKKLPLGNASVCESLPALLQQSDFVSLHVPGTPQTHLMIGATELSKMKKGAYLINASRGNVVDIDALAEAIKEGSVAGAAIDVFPHEPADNKDKFTSPLQGLPNVILTPHIGGSTQEAQYSIGVEVAESLLRYLRIGSSSGAVNFPNVELPVHQGTHRILNVHQNKPGVLGEINSIASSAGANIQAQYLATDPFIGYLIMDVEKEEAEILAEQIGKLERSIRTRLVY